MTKALAVGAAVLALAVSSPAPAQASGDKVDGPVSIGVIGDGLRVREVRVLLDHWRPGATARLSEWRGGRWVREVRGWKDMTSKRQGRVKYEIAAWKINKNFRHQSRICAEVSRFEERMPCVTVKR